MARPFRIELPEAFYSVICRGNVRFPGLREEHARGENIQKHRLGAWCSLSQVKAAVAEEYACDEAELLGCHSRGDEARHMLLHMAY